MTVLIRPTDLIPVQIDDMTFYFKGMTLVEKQKLQSALSKFQNMSKEKIAESVDELMKASIDILKKTLKKVDGIKLADGSDWAVELVDNELSDKCVDDLFCLPQIESVITIAGAVVGGNVSEGKEILGTNGKPLKNVVVKKTMIC